MIVCPKFVLLNMSKTGSTFARTAIKTLLSSSHNGIGERIIGKVFRFPRSYEEMRHPNLRERHRSAQYDQHGTYLQIPEKYRDRTIVCIVRNPFDRFVSQFKYGWWKKVPLLSTSELESKFPEWPKLTFNQFLQYKLHVRRQYLVAPNHIDDTIGMQTIEFSLMCSTDPNTFIERLGVDFISSGDFMDFLPKRMVFLRTECLNKDLYEFLHRTGFPPRRIKFILGMDRVSPPTGKLRERNDAWQSYYSDTSLVDYVYNHERHLLRIFKALNLGDHMLWPRKS